MSQERRRRRPGSPLPGRRDGAPRKAAPRKAAPRKAAPRKAAPRKAAQRRKPDLRRESGSGRRAASVATPQGNRPRTRSGPGIGGGVVEGLNAVRELLVAGRRHVELVVVAAGAPGAREASSRVTNDRASNGRLAAVLALAEERSVRIRQASPEQVRSMASTESPQGVIAYAEPVKELRVEDLLDLGGASGGDPGKVAARPFLVLLDGVTDPHNLGAVMRVALCAGATGVVFGRHRSARLTPAATKAAAGAIEWLPVAVSGIASALTLLKGAGVWTVGLDADGETFIWDLPFGTEAIALVLGAEGKGLSRLTRERCDLLISIPLSGPLGSLNVAAAAAVACLEVARRRRA